MKVIVAGMPKTGTTSMTAALTHLGYNVYDFLEQFYYLHDEWQQIFTKGGNVELFRKMFKDVDAVSDSPGYAFWEEIHEAFPDSKIILMARDENSWYKSFLSQIKEFNDWSMFKIARIITPTGRRLFSYYTNKYAVCFGIVLTHPWRTIFSSETVLKQRYRQHNSYLLQNAPKDKLLVFNMRDGWEPLCKFLNVDVPDIPFPHKNVGGSAYKDAGQENPIMRRMLTEVKIVTVTFSMIFLALVSVSIRTLY